MSAENASTTGDAGGQWKRWVADVGGRFALLWLLVVIVILFTFLPATGGAFMTADNIRTLVAQQSVTAILALAAMVPLTAMQFDLSVGSVLAIVTLVIAKLTASADWGVVPAMVLALVLGLAIACVNGVLVAYVGASSFIVTLGVTTVLGGFAVLYTGGDVIVGVPQSLISFANGSFGLAYPTWLMIGVALVVGYVMRYTVIGRQWVQIGANPESALLVGIPIKRRILTTFLVAGLLAGVAGIVLTAQTGVGNPTVGLNLTLPAVTATFLGSTVVRPGQFNVLGTLIGVFFTAVGVNGLSLAGVASWVEPVFTGTALLVSICIATVIARRRGTRVAAI